MNWDKFLDALDYSEMDGLKAAITRRNGNIDNLLTSDEMALAIKGQKIDCIRSIRNRINCGLIEAKALMDNFLRQV